MPCKACGENKGLEVCLNCGHSFCSMHRTESGGAPTCTPCVKEEAERARRRKERKEQAPTDEAADSPAPVVAAVQASAPLPEPKSAMTPILFGLGAAAPVAGYLHWLGGTLVVDHELAAWGQTAITVLGSLFAFAGVWAIVKTKS